MAYSKKDIAVIILAAGKGSRLKSSRSKVLHEIAGLPLLSHVINAASGLKPQKIVTVLAENMEDAAALVAPHDVAIQKSPKGTGDAVKAAMPSLNGFKGNILVLLGDVPLVRTQTLDDLLAHHQEGNFGATFLAMAPPDPKGYGRIFQNPDGSLARIVEEADANELERGVRLVSSGIMVLDGSRADEYLALIDNKNAQGEFYLVDIVKIIQAAGGKVGVIRGDYAELRGINTRAQLAELEMVWQHNRRLSAMENGATLQDPNTVYFYHDTKIGQDVTIGANVVFGANVVVEDYVTIHPFCHLEGVKVEPRVSIGPFARIRGQSVIGMNSKIGNFVEVKNSKLQQGVKAGHLAYIGDADVGDNVNFSCGAITVNYDGHKKHKTTIGKNVMVGSNVNLVAPVSVADNAYIAAGTTVTENVAENQLVIGRVKAESKARKPKN